MGGDNNGDTLREHPMVLDDGPPQEDMDPQASRRHHGRLPHPRRCRNPRRPPHRLLRQPPPQPPLLPRRQLPTLHRSRLRLPRW